MGRIDPNLRDLLDSLSVEKGVRHPTDDLETLRTIVDRLGVGEPAPTHPEEDAVPDFEARRRLREAEEERDELARRYAELESRIHETATPPAPGDGESSVRFVEDEAPLPETPEMETPPEEEEEEAVRFERVDVGRSPSTDLYGVPADDEPTGPEDEEELLEFAGTTRPRPTPDEQDWSSGTDESDWAVGDIQATPAWDDPDSADNDWMGSQAPPDETWDAAQSEPHDDDLAELERQLADLQSDLDALSEKDAKVHDEDDEDDEDDGAGGP